MNPVTMLLPFIRESIQARASFNAFAANAIQERMNQDGKETPKDMITFWMAQHHKKPDEWTRDHVATEASSSLYAKPSIFSLVYGTDRSLM